jgi:hypothetical protein
MEPDWCSAWVMVSVSDPLFFILLRATHWVFPPAFFAGKFRKYQAIQNNFQLPKRWSSWGDRAKMAYWHNLTRKGRDSHGDDLGPPFYICLFWCWVGPVRSNHCPQQCTRLSTLPSWLKFTTTNWAWQTSTKKPISLTYMAGNPLCKSFVKASPGEKQCNNIIEWET